MYATPAAAKAQALLSIEYNGARGDALWVPPKAIWFFQKTATALKGECQIWTEFSLLDTTGSLAQLQGEFVGSEITTPAPSWSGLAFLRTAPNDNPINLSVLKTLVWQYPLRSFVSNLGGAELVFSSTAILETGAGIFFQIYRSPSGSGISFLSAGTRKYG